MKGLSYVRSRGTATRGGSRIWWPSALRDGGEGDWSWCWETYGGKLDGACRKDDMAELQLGDRNVSQAGKTAPRRDSSGT
jgi:hypothetical protein